MLVLLFMLSMISVNAQIKFNRNIPNEAHKKIAQLLPKGINNFSFSPNGGWVIITKTNASFSRNIPNECYTKIKYLKSKGHKIKQVSFPPKGGTNSWIIITDKSTFARNIPNECYTKIQEFKKNGKRIKSVSFPYKSNNNSKNAWVIITTDGSFSAKNIPDECFQILRNLSESDMPGKRAARKINQVSFTPSGGWVVFADDYFFARNIPDEAFKKLESYQKSKYKPHIIAFTPNGKGWSLIANDKYSRTPKDLIRKFENNVNGKSIWKVMRDNNVPGVSVGVVINGKLAWSTAYGHLKLNNRKHAVHPESMFQAASVSKVLAAIGAFKMVETQTSIKLDDNLRDKNSPLSIKIPLHSTNSTMKGIGEVTIETILEHTSGINKQGYKGYGVSISSVPSLDEIISKKSKSGKAAVNSNPITLMYPDSIYKYSGAAFTILQKLTEDVTKMKYNKWMKTNVLNKMGMKQSNFTIQPENIYAKKNLSYAYGKNKIYRHPEFAAAGLYTNAKELSNVIVTINHSGKFNGRAVISIANALSLSKGMGTKQSDNKIQAKNKFYNHGGTNKGYRAFLIGFRNIEGDNNINNSGIVVLTNVDNTSFRYDVVNAVIKAYGW